MNTLTQQQINQYQWQAADGVARIVNPNEKPTESDFYKRHSEGLNWGDYLNKEHAEFEQFAKQHAYFTNAPDGIYSGEAFELIWQNKHTSEEGWTDETSHITYEVYENDFSKYDADKSNGFSMRQFLRLKPSHLPAVLTTQPEEEWKDRYNEAWQWQDKDGAWCNSDFGPERKEYGLSFVRWSDRMIGYPTRQTWHLNTPPAEQEAETVEYNIEHLLNIERLYNELQTTLPQKDQRIAELSTLCDELMTAQEPFENENIILKARIAELEREREWISVEDRLPDVKGFYMVYCNDRANIKTQIAWYYPDLDIKFNMLDHVVTHWMPLPTPPQH